MNALIQSGMSRELLGGSMPPTPKQLGKVVLYRCHTSSCCPELTQEGNQVTAVETADLRSEVRMPITDYVAMSGRFAEMVA